METISIIMGGKIGRFRWEGIRWEDWRAMLGINMQSMYSVVCVMLLAVRVLNYVLQWHGGAEREMRGDREQAALVMERVNCQGTRSK